VLRMYTMHPEVKVWFPRTASESGQIYRTLTNWRKRMSRPPNAPPPQ
jgi:hypothetical protein